MASYERQRNAATNQFTLATEGMIPRQAFFNPENLQQIMATDMAGAL